MTLQKVADDVLHGSVFDLSVNHVPVFTLGNVRCCQTFGLRISNLLQLSVLLDLKSFFRLSALVVESISSGLSCNMCSKTSRTLRYPPSRRWGSVFNHRRRFPSITYMAVVDMTVTCVVFIPLVIGRGEFAHEVSVRIDSGCG